MDSAKNSWQPFAIFLLQKTNSVRCSIAHFGLFCCIVFFPKNLIDLFVASIIFLNSNFLMHIRWRVFQYQDCRRGLQNYDAFREMICLISMRPCATKVVFQIDGTLRSTPTLILLKLREWSLNCAGLATAADITPLPPDIWPLAVKYWSLWH